MMRKLILLFFLASFFCGYAQQKTMPNKLKYHSFSVVPLSIYFDNNSGGLALSGAVSFTYNKHLFSLGLSAGSEFVIIARYTDNFEQINLFYGKELKLSRTLFIDLHTGAGYFSLSGSH